MKSLMLMILLLVGVAHLAAQSGGPYSLDWSSIDGGGGISTGAGNIYELTGVIGQPDAGQLSGGEFILEGGFLCELGLPLNDGLPLLNIRRSAPGFVELYWPADLEGVALEAANDCGAHPWEGVNAPVVKSATEHVVTLPIIANRFFRLRVLQP